MDEDCPFCGIAAGEEPAHEVYRDDDVVAFLDRSPAVESHTLVAPTAHREELTDMTPDAVGRLFRVVRQVGGAIESAYDPDGLSVIQSSGAAAGQDVFHVHVHLFPRYDEDDITLAPARYPLSEGEGERVAGALRDAL